MSTEDIFQALRFEIIRLGLDDALVSVDAPEDDDEAGWWCGVRPVEREDDLDLEGVRVLEGGAVASTLDEALDGLLQTLRSIRAPGSQLARAPKT